MKKLNLLFLLIFISVIGKGQYIIAGQHDSTDYYYDVNPDTTLYGQHNGPAVDYYIDINGDGIIDFDIWACSCSGLGTGINNCKIIPYNNNEICFAHIDSCIGNIYPCIGNFIDTFPLALSLDSINIIDSNRIWESAVLNLQYESFELQCYTCSGGLFDTNTLYIGVRIKKSNETLYGWIKLNNVFVNGFTLLEYACKKDTIIIDTSKTQNPQIIGVFPNPVNDIINIQLPTLDTIQDLIITDILGRIIYEKTNCGNYISIDVSKWDQGIYLYQITDLIKTKQGKFVIKRK